MPKKASLIQNTPRTKDTNKEETIPVSYVEGLKRTYEFLPERPRFLTLSDKQILDRTYQPNPGCIITMNACNDTYFSDLSLNREERLLRLNRFLYTQ